MCSCKEEGEPTEDLEKRCQIIENILKEIEKLYRSGFPVTHVELGNELYKDDYKARFVNGAHSYMKASAPAPPAFFFPAQHTNLFK